MLLKRVETCWKRDLLIVWVLLFDDWRSEFWRWSSSMSIHSICFVNYITISFLSRNCSWLSSFECISSCLTNSSNSFVLLRSVERSHLWILLRLSTLMKKSVFWKKYNFTKAIFWWILASTFFFADYTSKRQKRRFFRYSFVSIHLLCHCLLLSLECFKLRLICQSNKVISLHIVALKHCESDEYFRKSVSCIWMISSFDRFDISK